MTNDDKNIDSDLKPHFDLINLTTNKDDITLINKRLSMLTPDLALSYLSTMRKFSDLEKPLYGKYRLVKSENGIQKQKHLAQSFYPPSSLGYSKSHVYRFATPPGSVFKIATAYAGLKKRYQNLPARRKTIDELNPLTLYDESSGSSILGRFLDGTAIPRLYKGGRLPKSHGIIGRVDLLTAIERSSNIYFSILAGDYLDEPMQLIESAKDFGYGTRTGIDLPGEYAGTLPSDLRDNKTGLYSFAIGQHAFDGTPLQTAVMLSALANEGNILKPHILKSIHGSDIATSNPLEANAFPFQKELKTLGINFPLFTKTVAKQFANIDQAVQPEALRSLFMPAELRAILLESLHRVVNGPFGSARPNRIKTLYQNPHWMRSYLSVKNSLVGKTSTAEFRYHPTLDRESRPITCKHASFGGISFKATNAYSTSGKWAEPELVVVVSLPFGDYGKEAAPLAALIVKKWRELVSKYETQNTQPSF